jgi:hypothetical protein
MGCYALICNRLVLICNRPVPDLDPFITLLTFLVRFGKQHVWHVDIQLCTAACFISVVHAKIVVIGV